MIKKFIFLLLLAAVIILSALTGFFIGENKDISISEEERLEILYKSLSEKTQKEKESKYNEILKAETSPREVKYVLNIAMEDASKERKNELLSQYLNHIQYYMSTYSDFLLVYQTIMNNMKSYVDFESPDSYKNISDKVLKTIIQEIYISDMKIIMPTEFQENGFPYIIVDYDSIKENFKEILNKATIDYIEFKEIAQKGELSDENGEYNMDKIGEYIVKANNFIVEHGNYPLVADVVYSYILGSKMYLNIYDVSNEFVYTEEELLKFKEFINNYPDTPISQIIEEILLISENEKIITMEKISEWNNLIDSLLGGNNAN